MPTTRLSQRTVDRLDAPDPSGKQVLHFDSELKGSAVLCSGKSTARTYVCQRTLPSGKSRRVTIGAANEISFAEARSRAAETLDAMRRGVDPQG